MVIFKDGFRREYSYNYAIIHHFEVEIFINDVSMHILIEKIFNKNFNIYF